MSFPSIQLSRRPIAQPRQRTQGRQQVCRIKLNHEVYTVRVSQETVGIDRQAPNDQIANPGAVERLHNFNKVRGLHGSWDERRKSNCRITRR
jgi:hypothetical protein